MAHIPFDQALDELGVPADQQLIQDLSQIGPHSTFVTRPRYGGFASLAQGDRFERLTVTARNPISGSAGNFLLTGDQAVVLGAGSQAGGVDQITAEDFFQLKSEFGNEDIPTSRFREVVEAPDRAPAFMAQAQKAAETAKETVTEGTKKAVADSKGLMLSIITGVIVAVIAAIVGLVLRRST